MVLLKVLVVDDSATARMAVDILFKRNRLPGVQVEGKYVPSACDAIEVITDWRPHCMITDNQMGSTDGLILAKVAAKKYRLPVCMMTSGDLDAIRPRQQECGIQLLVAKPVDFSDLRGWLLQAAKNSLPRSEQIV